MLPQTHKAQRCTLELGDISLEVAMLPDGSYRLSYIQASEVVDKSRNSMLRFCRSNYLKSLLGKDFECYTPSGGISIKGANRPIIPITFELACLYWQKCAVEGNIKARALVIALLKRSLYDLADAAFGIPRHHQERDCLLAEDLSDAGVARIEVASQSLAQQQLSSRQPETLTERELKLKIQLAKLDLERERLQHRQDKNPFPAKDIDKIGVAPWQVTSWTQKTLGWSDASATNQLLRQLGYGLKSKHWLTVKIIGDLWVMPHSSFNSLVEVVEKFKSGQSWH